MDNVVKLEDQSVNFLNIVVFYRKHIRYARTLVIFLCSVISDIIKRYELNITSASLNHQM